MKYYLFFFSILLLFLTDQSFAQSLTETSNKEIGLRINNLRNFDLIYKKQKTENKYSRFRLTSLNTYFIDTITNSGFSYGAAFGREKRIIISEKVNLIKGWELITGANINNYDSPWGSFNVGAGIVLGVQYDFSKHFSINMEAIPAIMSTFSYNQDAVNLKSINLGFGANRAALGLIYRF